MLNLSIPEHIQPLRARVLGFIEQEVYPLENDLLENKVASRRGELLRGLMDKAKGEGLWALGHPEELGGGKSFDVGSCLSIGREARSRSLDRWRTTRTRRSAVGGQARSLTRLSRFSKASRLRSAGESSSATPRELRWPWGNAAS